MPSWVIHVGKKEVSLAEKYVTRVRSLKVYDHPSPPSKRNLRMRGSRKFFQGEINCNFLYILIVIVKSGILRQLFKKTPER